ncbi:hypothetical protein [Alicyclobacillus fructus]|uniref:hypothetical protein n=1 Tax=Alicyclobacillus fructus TaxID=2816082 RepID=UPI001A8DDA31|nr:hypothetical protein [Alicyclobacillus fructus]
MTKGQKETYLKGIQTVKARAALTVVITDMIERYLEEHDEVDFNVIHHLCTTIAPEKLYQRVLEVMQDAHTKVQQMSL